MRYRSRPTRRLVALAALLAAGATGCAPEREASGAGQPGGSAAWLDHAARLASPEPVGRFVEATQVLLGTPYRDGPLGEGAEGGPDPDPRVDFARADCVTYLEQSLALALASPEDEDSFLRLLDAIRYRDGRVDFVTRNHYMVLDWIPANAWLLEDVTAAVGGDATRKVRRTIDRAAFLRRHEAEPREGVDDPRELTIDVVPSEAVERVAPALRDGDLVFWVGKAEGIFVVHTGLVVRGDDGGLLFRHASSKAGRALDESFAGYAERATFALGFLVLRLREDASRPPGPGPAAAG